MITLPDDIQHKILWCENLLQQVDSVINDYVASEPIVATPFSTPTDDGLNCWRIRLELRTPPPAELSFLVGDFIQNLRSSLDYLAHALVVTTSGTPVHGGGRSTSFPIVTKQRKTSAPTIAGCESDDVHKIVEFFQPYTTDDPFDHALHRINELANEYKHRELRTLTKMAGYPAHLALVDRSVSPYRGTATSCLRFLPEGDWYDGLFFMAPEGIEPVAIAEFDTVLVLDGGQRPAMSVPDELDYYLRVVRDLVIPSFRVFFSPPWPEDLFRLQPFHSPQVLGSVPSSEVLVEAFASFYAKISQNHPSPRILVLGMDPGISTEDPKSQCP